MAKNKLGLIILVIGLLLIAGMLIQNKYEVFSVIGSDTSITRYTSDIQTTVCGDTINEMTLGALPGQCYIYTLNNVQSVKYVESITQTGPTEGPQGQRYTCNYQINSPSSSRVCEDGKVFTSVGTTTDYCTSNSDCNGYICANHICTDRQVGTCDRIGRRSCIDSSTYHICQANLQWSGILHCADDSSCITGQCVLNVPACTESNWQFTLSPATCPVSQIQTKVWSKIGNCNGGVTKSNEPIACTYQAPACTYTYSAWGNCQSSNTQTRTYTSSPAGCQGVPVTTQSCIYDVYDEETNQTGSGNGTGTDVTCDSNQLNIFNTCFDKTWLWIIAGIIILVLVIALIK